jgi:hypothetical protein
VRRPILVGLPWEQSALGCFLQQATKAGCPIQAQKRGMTPISCHAVLERSACAPFIKERRMELINATSLRRKSGQWGTQSWLMRPVVVVAWPARYC